jgi:hypothetical protein
VNWNYLGIVLMGVVNGKVDEIFFDDRHSAAFGGL